MSSIRKIIKTYINHPIILGGGFLLGASFQANAVMSDSENADQTNQVISDKQTKPSRAMLMPLTLAINLNDKYVGQVNAKIDPRTNQGVVEQQRLRAMLKPLLGQKAFNKLVDGLSGLDEYVDFKDVERAGLIAKFDNFSLSLNISLLASDLVTQSYKLKSRSRIPNPDLYQSPSRFTAGVNIAASQVFQQSEGQGESNDPQVVLNGLVNVGGFGGVTLEGGARYTGKEDKPWERTTIIASKDFFNSALRLTGGEITPRTKAFQGGQRMLGVGLYRAYSNIRPFQIVRPTGRTRFNLDESSRVDVYVNELLVDSIDLEKGSYSLSDFPITSRSNDVRLEITGRSGRAESLRFDVYGGSELLAPGLSDFGVFVGNRQAAKQFDYSGGQAATAYYRRGVTGQLSAGATLQATESAQQLGLLLTYGSDYGLIDLEAASSYHSNDRAKGSAYRLSYRNTFSLFADNDLRISANGEYRTERFQSAFDDLALAPQKWSSALQASWIGAGGWSATMGLSATENRGINGGNSHSINGNFSRRIGNFQVGATLAFGQSINGQDTERFGLTLGYRPVGTFSSTAQYNSIDDQMQLDFRRRSRQQIEGLNLGAQFRDSQIGRQARVTADYKHNRFESAVQHTYNEPNSDDKPSIGKTQVRFASFVGLSNGSVGIGRPVQSGFVLAKKHRSLRKSKVEIRNGNQFIARPGFLGAAVIPLSRAYSVNKFAVSVDPLPLGYDIGEGSITVFPGHGSSFNTPIGSDASRTAMGFLIKDGQPMVLVSGLVSPKGDLKDKEKWQRPLFTNRGGRFVADRLKPGEYEIIIDEHVFATFNVSEDAEGLVNLGKVENE